jgi:hypothetical protein
MGKISSGGLLLTKGNLMLDLSIRLSLESGFLCLDGSAREDPHLGEYQKEACHCD